MELASVTDSATGITTTYYYDFTGRLTQYVETGGRFHTVRYNYDSENNLSSVYDSYNGTTSYTYDEDNRVEAVTNNSSGKTYVYDDLGRLESNGIRHNNEEIFFQVYDYEYNANGTTSNQVVGQWITSDSFDVYLDYTYDANGNITSISDGTYTTSYVYDSQNQLIRENNQYVNKTWAWEYDNAGNILNRKEYAYTTGTLGTPLSTKTYTYGDSNWGDLLTGYDGKAITYDNIGNMLTYGSKSFTWEHGRELAAIDDWQMTYNADGVRLQRSNPSTGMVYDYYCSGNQLTMLNYYDDDVEGLLKFSYDAEGTVLSAEYCIEIYIDGILEYVYEGTFYYLTNPQGDVVALLDESGNKMVEYTYDAYGKPLTTTYHCDPEIVYYNPLRYRGYVYDIETELYYLQSRYYDPEIGRFISADDPEMLFEDYEATLQYNLFAYCWNNPVNMYDPDGYWTLALAGGGYLATVGTLGASNIWNPVGWAILGAVVVVVAINVYNSEKTSSSNDVDPYARPGQKKQGRERKNKARKSKDWKPRSNPKPPKKHTPGRDHRRYK